MERLVNHGMLISFDVFTSNGKSHGDIILKLVKEWSSVCESLRCSRSVAAPLRKTLMQGRCIGKYKQDIFESEK